MTPIIKICNEDNYGIVITDLTQDSDEYVPESIQEMEAYYLNNKFKYSETCTINVIQQNTIKESKLEEAVVGTTFMDHDSYLDESHYKMESDGYYVINHLILPTVDWLQTQINKKSSILSSGMDIYVSDCDTIYRYLNNQLQEVDPAVVATVNTENTTISRVSVDQFSICYLYDCYISLCKQVFAKINLRCLTKSNVSDINFKRDFLWMTINVIKYYVEFDQLYEAQRLLQEINYCGGICNEQNLSASQDSGCGCNR